MTDLLPIVFSRGQNQSVDPRVAPPDVLLVAQNVRWRKDGRPAKRYGAAAISTTGLDSGGSVYGTFAVNFVDQWRGQPIMALGSGVRRLVGPKWSSIAEANASNLPHFGPGRHDPVARSETKQLLNPTTCYANGVVLYAWDDGTSIHYQVSTPAGAILIADQLLAFPLGTYPRLVAQGNSIYLLYNAANVLKVAVFDTPTMQFTTTATVAAAIDAGTNYDACPRSATDWLLVYEHASTLVVNRMTGFNTVGSTQSIAVSVGCEVAIAGTSTSSVFVAWCEPGAGAIRFNAFNVGLTASSGGPTTIETDAHNFSQPGVVIDDNSDACVFWGGIVGSGSPTYRYMRYATATASGSAGAVTTIANVMPRSKPFYGASSAAAAHDGRYVWVTNYTESTAWADQSTLFLLWINPVNANCPAKVALWTPNLPDNPGDANATQVVAHLSDVVTDGTTFWTSFPVTLETSSSTGGQNIGVDSVSFASTLGRQRYAARDTARAGRALQVSGGVGYEFNGSTEETGFAYSPVFDASSAASAGAGLTTGASYFYRAVYEWIDSQGRRHRSAPSDPVNVLPTGTNNRATLLISTLAAFSRAGTPVIHVYRTLGNGTTYQRVTTVLNAPSALGGATPYVTFVDSLSDAALIARNSEFIYTDGGVIPNAYAPPCTFLAACSGRVWCGGLLDRNVISASKLLVDGEPTQFVDQGESEFDVFLPEECTGLASLDGTLVAFAREAIYLVTGDGPDDQGVGSFSPPQRLPSDVGCTDWRSVLETSIGIFFQSKRGIYLLPRGFGTPVFVGQDVANTLSLFPVVVSATLVSTPSAGNGVLGEVTARFVVSADEVGSATGVLVYDLRAQGWSVDFAPGGTGYGPSGTWLDTFVATRCSAVDGSFSSIQAETPGAWTEDSSFIVTALGTGDVRPFGLAGYGSFKSVLVVGEYRGDSVVKVATSVDGQAADVSSFAVTSPDGPDGVVYLDVTPRVQKGSSLRVTVSDSTNGSPTEGFIAQGIMIETELIGKTERLAQGRRA